MDNDLEGFTDATDSVKAGKQIQPKPFLGDVLTRENVADRRHLRWTKSVVTIAMTTLIGVMNWLVVQMLNSVVNEEMRLISLGLLPPTDRTVTTSVYLALIAGTVAEVSALFFIIVKSMFKGETDSSESD